MLHDSGRLCVSTVTNDEAIRTFFQITRIEGIIPALESAHALAFAVRLATQRPSKKILVNLSGRGNKDADYILENYGATYG